jgi:hypothetical protein
VVNYSKNENKTVHLKDTKSDNIKTMARKLQLQKSITKKFNTNDNIKILVWRQMFAKWLQKWFLKWKNDNIKNYMEKWEKKWERLKLFSFEVIMMQINVYVLIIPVFLFYVTTFCAKFCYFLSYVLFML